MSILKIDLSAIRKNISLLKARLNQNQKFCLVAKANCYGLGSYAVCEAVDDLVDYYAVSSSDEFFEIKKVSEKPILILEPIYENITKLTIAQAEFSVCNKISFDAIFNEAKKYKNILFKIHIAVNTGMNRFGFKSFDEFHEVLTRIKKLQNIVICGVFSHYYDANNENFVKNQDFLFCEFCNKLSKHIDTSNVVFHTCSSQATIKKPSFDMVRVGVLAYLSFSEVSVQLSSKIVDIQTLSKGETAGYGGVFVAKKKTKLAIVHIGYADGIPRNIIKNGYVLINGCYAKIVAICMDSLIVDATGISSQICDEVVVFGKSGDKQIFVCDVARWCDTIDYEIISRISSRVKRKYIR